MSPSLMANCTFISPTTLSALASFAASAAQARSSMDFGQRMGRQRAGAVAGMNAGFLDMLHDAGDEHVGAVAQRIDVDLDGVGQVAVDEHRRAAGDDHGFVDVALRGLHGRADDLHGAAAQHVGRADDHGIADLGPRSDRFGAGLGDAVVGLGDRSSLLSSLAEPVAVFGKVDGIRRGAENRECRPASSASASFSGVWPPNCTMTPSSVPLACSLCRISSTSSRSAVRNRAGRRCRSRSTRFPGCS
jgi:hypothetical protein